MSQDIFAEKQKQKTKIVLANLPINSTSIAMKNESIHFKSYFCYLRGIVFPFCNHNFVKICLYFH